MIGPSHVLLALGWDRQAAQEALRFSLGRFTTVDELDRAMAAIADALTLNRFDSGTI